MNYFSRTKGRIWHILLNNHLLIFFLIFRDEKYIRPEKSTLREFGLQIDKKKGATRFCFRIAPFIRLTNYLDNLFYELNSCLMSRSQELRLID